MKIEVFMLITIYFFFISFTNYKESKFLYVEVQVSVTWELASCDSLLLILLRKSPLQAFSFWLVRFSFYLLNENLQVIATPNSYQQDEKHENVSNTEFSFYFFVISAIKCTGS